MKIFIAFVFEMLLILK